MNRPDNLEEAEKIFSTVTKEVESGVLQFTDKKPKYITRLGCAPKMDDKDMPSKLRMIRDASYAEKGKIAINDLISKENSTMVTPHIPEYVKQFWGKKFGAMRDLKDFFRQMLLREHEYEYCGYSFCGMYFIDTRQPYGFRPSAANGQRFASKCIEINDRINLPPQLRNQTLVHVDDFSIAGTDEPECVQIEQALDRTFDDLQVKVSREKDIHATQTLRCHGMIFNLNFQDNPGGEQFVEIPPTKLVKFKRFLNSAIAFRVMTLRAVESLCGKIMHYAQMKPIAKVLVYSLVNWIYEHCRNNRRRSKKLVILPLRIVRALQFYLRALKYLQRSTFDEILGVSNHHITAASDACSNAGGFWIANKWSTYGYKDDDRKWHINFKEAHAVLTLIHTFGESLAGKRLKLFVDNKVVVMAYANKWSKSRFMMRFIFEIAMALMKYNISLFIEWTASDDNRLADMLSRGKVREFKNECKASGFRVDRYPTPARYIQKYEADVYLDGDDDTIEMLRFRKWLNSDPKQRPDAWWCKN